jgi:predicted RNA-binding protein with PUA-like domain
MPKSNNEKTDKRYWLLKSEPSAFSIEDLEVAPGKTTCWDGVRNYQARNFLRDSMKVGDQVFYYHSNSEPSGIVGIAEVVKEGYPDSTAFDPKDKHYDEKSDRKKPTWYMVDIKHVKTFKQPLSLAHLREIPALKNMALLQKGSRLSVQPVTETEWKAILELAKATKRRLVTEGNNCCSISVLSNYRKCIRRFYTRFESDCVCSRF